MPFFETDAAPSTDGRLTADPRTSGTGEGVSPGLQPLDPGKPTDGLIYIPTSYSANEPAPFAMTLHGAGGEAEKAIRLLLPFADEAGIVLLSPKARERTWDVILGGLGPDVKFIDTALKSAFAKLNLDRRRMAVQGFSDGASYALSLGLTNGDLFTHVLALSPGFIAGGERRGKPEVFIAHGTRDQVLPIDRTSRRIVPGLEDDGYSVEYVEFPGATNADQGLRSNRSAGGSAPRTRSPQRPAGDVRRRPFGG